MKLDASSNISDIAQSGIDGDGEYNPRIDPNNNRNDLTELPPVTWESLNTFLAIARGSARNEAKPIPDSYCLENPLQNLGSLLEELRRNEDYLYRVLVAVPTTLLRTSQGQDLLKQAILNNPLLNSKILEVSIAANWIKLALLGIHADFSLRSVEWPVEFEVLAEKGNLALSHVIPYNTNCGIGLRTELDDEKNPTKLTFYWTQAPTGLNTFSEISVATIEAYESLTRDGTDLLRMNDLNGITLPEGGAQHHNHREAVAPAFKGDALFKFNLVMLLGSSVSLSFLNGPYDTMREAMQRYFYDLNSNNVALPFLPTKEELQEALVGIINRILFDTPELELNPGLEGLLGENQLDDGLEDLLFKDPNTLSALELLALSDHKNKMNAQQLEIFNLRLEQIRAAMQEFLKRRSL